MFDLPGGAHIWFLFIYLTDLAEAGRDCDNVKVTVSLISWGLVWLMFEGETQLCDSLVLRMSSCQSGRQTQPCTFRPMKALQLGLCRLYYNSAGLFDQSQGCQRSLAWSKRKRNGPVQSFHLQQPPQEELQATALFLTIELQRLRSRKRRTSCRKTLGKGLHSNFAALRQNELLFLEIEGSKPTSCYERKLQC